MGLAEIDRYERGSGKGDHRHVTRLLGDEQHECHESRKQSGGLCWQRTDNRQQNSRQTGGRRSGQGRAAAALREWSLLLLFSSKMGFIQIVH